jgi:hypothetical protein
MRSIKYILLLAGLYCILPCCKKEKLLTYDTANSIYFDYQTNAGSVRTDSINLTFAYSSASVVDSNVMIPVHVTGGPFKADRVYSVQADPSSTAKAGTHYTLPDKLVLPSGSLRDSFPIKFIRTADMQSNTLELILHLVPSRDFSTNIQWLDASTDYISGDSVNGVTIKIYVSDILQAGPYWTNVFAAYFGNFSVKKMQVLNQISGMPLNWPLLGLYDLNFGAKTALYAIETSRYLNDQHAAGQTVYEADGVTPMTMGVQYQ